MIGCLPTQAIAFGWKPGFTRQLQLQLYDRSDTTTVERATRHDLHTVARFTYLLTVGCGRNAYCYCDFH